MGTFIITDTACIDPTIQAARVTQIVSTSAGEVPVNALLEMETIVITPLSSDDGPVLILPADALRVRAKLQTDASFIILAESEARCNILQGWLMVFAYSGLIPEVLSTNGEVWAANFPPELDPVVNTIRILVERKVVD